MEMKLILRHRGDINEAVEIKNNPDSLWRAVYKNKGASLIGVSCSLVDRDNFFKLVNAKKMPVLDDELFDTVYGLLRIKTNNLCMTI